MKNNTEYTATITYDVAFWADAEGTILLGTSSATVEAVGPYAEFTVHVDVPAAAQQGMYYYNWTNYYNEIKVN